MNKIERELRRIEKNAWKFAYNPIISSQMAIRYNELRQKLNDVKQS